MTYIVGSGANCCFLEKQFFSIINLISLRIHTGKVIRSRQRLTEGLFMPASYITGGRKLDFQPYRV